MTENLTLADVEKGQRLPDLSIDVGVTNVVLGALASRDWRPMHHDKDFAVERNLTELLPPVTLPDGRLHRPHLA